MSIRISPRDKTDLIPSHFFESALKAFDRGDYVGASKALSGAFDDSPFIAKETVQLAECYCLAAIISGWNGDSENAEKYFQLVGDECTQGAFGVLGFLAWSESATRRGDYQTAIDVSTDLISTELAQESLGVAEPLIRRGAAHIRNGSSRCAKFDFESAFYIGRLTDCKRVCAESANYLGIATFMEGDFEAAISWYRTSCGFDGGCWSNERQGLAKLNIGVCAYKLGTYEVAKLDLQAAAGLFEDSASPLNLTRTHIALGNVHRLTRDFETARQYLTRAYSSATALQVPREECLALEFLGDVYRDEGKADEARRYYKRGLAIAEAIAPAGDLVLEIRRREGECLILEGRAGEGLEVLARALTHSRKLGDRFEEGVILRCLASGMAATGDLDRALPYASDAIEVLEGIDARHEHAIARIVAAEILIRQSEQPGTGSPRDVLDQAWETILVAQQLTRALGVEHWSRAVQRLQSRITRRRAEEARYAGERERRRRAAAGDPARAPDAPPGAPRGGQDRPDDIIIAESRAMKDVMQAVEAFAPEDEPLLLTGETGTGKEVIARRVHRLSSRSEQPFVAVNVTAIPDSMFEREFFGHARGAFSGAEDDRDGLAATADGGTLFLDEIGDLPSEIQSKLLRLLQDGSYHTLGDPRERRANLRIIAATNADLERAVARGRFREDLYYRLAILTIPLPPLRDRPEDVIPLLDHFLSEAAGRRVAWDRYFNRVSLRLLQKHVWPGNVRELTMIARRAHIDLMRNGRVELEVGTGANAMVITGPEQAASAASGSGDDLTDPTPSLSRAHILLALEEAGGNRSEAARLLGVSRTTLYRRLARLGLDPSHRDGPRREDDI